MTGGQVSSDNVISPLEAILSPGGFAILDGGFATHLEDVLGKDISSSPLWSASLLDSEEGNKAIVQTHLSFLEAGADVVSTSSYQVSDLAYLLAGQSIEKAAELLVRSIELGEEARKKFLLAHPTSRRPLLLLSLGPYGAALANGSEYTGDYYKLSRRRGSKDVDKEPITLQDLEDFHFRRLESAARSPAWTNVDIIAFETLPRLDEASVIRKALKRLTIKYPQKAAYVSFVFPNGNHLPWQAKPSSQVEEDMCELLGEVLQNDEKGMTSPLLGVGINCTKPRFILRLVESMTSGLSQLQLSRKPHLFLYPDGGLVWDGIARRWKASDGSVDTRSWAAQLAEAAHAIHENSTQSLWAGCFIGGCCKATAEDIRQLRSIFDINPQP